ncbi:hypothetical protein SELR_11120 [Selenomonas ruminantium subsp. lactilytica TAM6421]|uniref:Uncharacterized protein n=1 Tax=Selenomonas ruminantium subsp. lactilytica (strain NBRC 103574 / TAM6421) TaxID=927704 RepID=I0GPY3_SELRL|nr:hypothetical protein [Selenomonas ruminantium]BAL82820.1 hypothetical protein SELR_11120 [Selenomonas ruminantium subsp. lactilytica TAM6421]
MSFKEQRIVRLFGRSNGHESIVKIQYADKSIKVLVSKTKKPLLIGASGKGLRA